MEAIIASIGTRSIFPIFIAIFAVLGIVNFVYFYLGKNGRLKRILWPIDIILTGILFAGFMYLLGLGSRILLIAVPMILFVTIANLTMVRFCLACGHMVMNQNPFWPLKRCPKCHAAFNQDNRRQSDELSVLQGDRDC